MRAILSDIHGNLEALTAVLADINQRGIQRVDNLGDTLGYGPNPLECLDLTMSMQIVLMGNFDHAVLNTPDGFCSGAEQSILWTQAQFAASPVSPSGRNRLDYLAQQPSRVQQGETVFVHGSARNFQNEYIFPEDIYNPDKLEKIAECFGPLCFGGHTHIPGIFRRLAKGKWEYINAEECQQGFPVAGNKLICNVGSVGQPRDGDEEACYVRFDGERIWYERVPYDIETTIRKIHAIPELMNYIGDRLRDGR